MDTAIKNGQLFGWNNTEDGANTIILPFMWDVTASYKDGSSKALSSILEASYYLDDCLDPTRSIKHKPFTCPPDPLIEEQNKSLRKKALRCIKALELGKKANQDMLDDINHQSELVFKMMTEKCKALLSKQKKVLLVGGEHSVSYALLDALNNVEKKPFSLLHLDAHLDCRDAYQGFRYSHASIIRKAHSVSKVSSISSVSIRDYCLSEYQFSQNQARKHHLFFQDMLDKRLFEGACWKACVDEIIQSLDKRIYISLDVDCLDASIVPSTGTPVSSGLTINQLHYLLGQLKLSKKEIVGADLVETGPNEGGLSARLLLQLLDLF